MLAVSGVRRVFSAVRGCRAMRSVLPSVFPFSARCPLPAVSPVCLSPGCVLQPVFDCRNPRLAAALWAAAAPVAVREVSRCAEDRLTLQPVSFFCRWNAAVYTHALFIQWVLFRRFPFCLWVVGCALWMLALLECVVPTRTVPWYCLRGVCPPCDERVATAARCSNVPTLTSLGTPATVVCTHSRLTPVLCCVVLCCVVLCALQHAAVLHVRPRVAVRHGLHRHCRHHGCVFYPFFKRLAFHY